jgi:hypothetical protein
VTVVLDTPADSRVAGRPPVSRRARALVAVLLVGAVFLFAVAVLRAAPGTARFDPVAPVFGGTAQALSLPAYGIQGMHVVGYEHGATARMTLPVTNTGLLPLTVTSVDLGGGVAPLLQVRDVIGLPLSIGPGETEPVEVVAELANCKFFHEREVQYYAGVELGFTVLGQEGTRSVAFDRPVMVHSPMIVGCPDRLLDRQANDRTDLTDAA